MANATFCLSVNQLIEHMGCFQFLAIRSHAIMNDLFTDFSVAICFQFSWVHSGVAKSHGYLRFNILFCSGCGMLNSHQQRVQVPIFPRAHHHSSLLFLTFAILLSIK